jgi:phosphatidylinositol alpha-mannosyltransferase
VLETSLDLEDGVQQYDMTMGEWLRSQGQDVHYLVGQTEERQLPNIHSLSRNIVATFNGNRINLPLLASRQRIRALVRQEKFDVLYVQAPYHPLMGQRVLLAADHSTLVVGSFNILPYSPLVRLANKALGVLLRPSLRKIDKMLAVSPAAARFEEKVFGLKAEVSPNVFRYDMFKQAQPFERYQGDVVTILFLGRLVPRKGCKLLLEAAAMLRVRHGLPEFRIVVCGKGPLEADLRRFTQDRGLSDIVEFTGFVSDEDKPRYYASADIAVFPSSGGESFGIVLLEAMASGNAVVLAGDNPGYRSVMEPRPELLFDPRNAAGLADKLVGLLENESKRQTFAAWGSDYTRQFDVSVVGQQLLDIFNRLSESKKLQ